jgi:hypothetical protein
VEDASWITASIRSSDSPRYFVPATSEGREISMTRVFIHFYFGLSASLPKNPPFAVPDSLVGSEKILNRRRQRKPRGFARSCRGACPCLENQRLGFSIPPFGSLCVPLFKNLDAQPQPHFHIIPRLLIESALELAER